MMKNMNNNEVAAFYDESSGSIVYGHFVYPILGPHQAYGFWSKDTNNYREAVINEVQHIVNRGRIVQNSKVLDAGCGVGGPAIYVATSTGANVTGITLSRKETIRGKRNALKASVQDLVRFDVQDFSKTAFPDNHFDVVYGIESICYAFPKDAFLREAYRILKPGGRIIISDGYLKRAVQNKREHKIVKNFIYGFALKELVTAKLMTEMIRSAGFINTSEESKLEEVRPSVQYFARLANRWIVITNILRFFHPTFLTLHRNFIACINAQKAIDGKIAEYAVHYGEKPA